MTVQFSEIKEANDGMGSSFDAFKAKSDQKIASLEAANATLQDRIEDFESRRNSPGRASHKAIRAFEKVIDNPKFKELAAGTLRDSGEIPLPPWREMLAEIK